MRYEVIALVVGMAMAEAMAFDSVAWEDKRAAHLREAERLQAVYTNCEARATTPATDVSVPIETFEDGSVKAIVNAKKAMYFLQQGYVWASGVLIRRFRQHDAAKAGGVRGVELEGKVDATCCVVDRMSKNGWADERARVIHGSTVIVGRKVYFSSPDSYVRVFDGSEVVARNLKLPGREDNGGRESARGGSKARNQDVRITGKGCDFDHAEGVVMFEGEVKVEYNREYTLTADKAYAFLEGTNELSRIVAIGNVVVSNGLRTGSCPMATYRRRRREIEMFADGDGRLARLEDRGKNASSVEGTRIRFWLDADQYEVENSTITVDEKGRKDLL